MTPFQLFLFASDPATVTAASAAGVDGFVVDWESRGKAGRQAGADTQIGTDGLEDLVRVRAATPASVICRVNRIGRWSRREVDAAIASGADELLLPMARGPADVERTLELVDGRCGLGILVETEGAVATARDLAVLPLSRVFVGLNDLSIQRGSDSIFDAVADGTVDSIREAFDLPFGFAGLTLPDRGHPIPCRLLIAEMARLNCSFGFLRRSYRRDVPDPAGHARALLRIREALSSAAAAGQAELERQHELLLNAIRAAPRVALAR